MRRHSPPRPMRHQSPPRRRGRGRSLSPLSRSQPAPPGDERARKAPAPPGWDGPPRGNNNKRFRSRSREWREPLNHDDPPYIDLSGNSRPPPREKVMRDRSRDRDRAMRPTKESDLKEVKQKHPPRRHSAERNMRNNEESYLNNYGNNMEMGQPMNFKQFSAERESRRNMPQPPSRKPPARDRHLSPKSNINNKGSKVESASERIKRLEKLVEKLVESNAAPNKSNFVPSNDGIPELIPSNSKFTTSMWLNALHEECLNRNYDEKSVIRYVQDKMTGIMKAWFKSVCNYDFTWPELKLLITKTFPDNGDFAHTLRLLVSRDKTTEETITQYFFSKLYLCEACKISGENAVSCLIDGLTNPFMKQEIKSYNFLTPEALYSDYFSKCPEEEVPVHMDHREVREVIPEYPREEFIPLEMEHRKPHMNKGKPYDRNEKRPPFGPMDRQKCGTCKKFGHSTVDCRHAPICYVCKKKGHIAAKCRFSNNLLITTATYLNEIPKIKCFVNGWKYYGVVDTGSTAVVLKKQVAEELQLKITPSLDVLKGFGGALVKTLGSSKILLTAGSVECKVEALITEDGSEEIPEIIIGQAFLCQDGVTFCQKNGEVSICTSTTVK